MNDLRPFCWGGGVGSVEKAVGMKVCAFSTLHVLTCEFADGKFILPFQGRMFDSDTRLWIHATMSAPSGKSKISQLDLGCLEPFTKNNLRPFFSRQIKASRSLDSVLSVSWEFLNALEFGCGKQLMCGFLILNSVLTYLESLLNILMGTYGGVP